jgi:hypothetical protein
MFIIDMKKRILLPMAFAAVSFTAAAQCPEISCNNSDTSITSPLGACGATFIFVAPTAQDLCKFDSVQFTFTGVVQTFTVPDGVTSVRIKAWGAKGGYGYPANNQGGNGGFATGLLSVTPGQVLHVYVGGMGANANTSNAAAGGFNGGGTGGIYPGDYGGGGGGGASDVRVSPYNLADRVIVAGGGGGGAFNSPNTDDDRGGGGGGLTGETGFGQGIQGNTGAATGGTQNSGGTAGNFTGWCTGFGGSLGQGGNAGTCNNAGGGGGGGYYGGGGGVWAGGGGGSSYIGGVTDSSTLTGINNDNGKIIISWATPTLDVVQIAGLPSGAEYPVGTTINVFEAIGGDSSVVTCSFTVTVEANLNTGVTVSGNTLTSQQNGATYQWFDCTTNTPIPNETNPSFTATQNGLYGVAITLGSCVDTSACTQISTVSVIENPDLIHMNVFPNPTNGEFTVNFGNTVSKAQIRILDVQGRMIESRQLFNTSVFTFDISKASQGIYAVEVQTDNGRAIFKIIKQ